MNSVDPDRPHTEWTARRTVRNLAVLLIYWAAACLALTCFMERLGFREDADRFDLPSMLDHTAARPFVYRALIPIIVNSATHAISERQRQELGERLNESSHLRGRFFRAEGLTAWTPELSVAYHLVYYLDFMALFLTLVTLRLIARASGHSSGFEADFLPVAFCVVLPIVFLAGGYFYDFPELLFLSLAYWTALKGRYWMLVLIVTIAAINKETAILIPILTFPALRDHLGQRKALVVCIAAGVCALIALSAVRYSLTLESNHGAPVELHFFENVRFWLTVPNYLHFTSILAPGIPFPKPENVLCLVAFGGVVIFGWKSMRPVERRLLIVAASINIPLSLIFGYPGEVRDLFLMLVPLYIAALRFFEHKKGY